MSKSELTQIIRRAEVTDKYSAIKSLCNGRKVLDVGCIGQDATMDSENWLHNIIRSVATSVTGVDISAEKIDKFNNLGYHMLQHSQLEKQNDMYEVIIMADVIEHVNDPVDFLRFYARFLTDSGLMVVTTPNANRAVNFFSILFLNNYSVNVEHTCWFCPKTLYEVIRRSGMKFAEIYWLKKYYNYKGLSFASSIVTGLSDLLAFFRKNYSQNFMVVLSK